LLPRRALGVAHAKTHDAKDIEPSIIRTATGVLAAVIRFISGERFANDVGARQLPALRQCIQDTLGPGAEANCQ
jgi:hypothetical protein